MLTKVMLTPEEPLTPFEVSSRRSLTSVVATGAPRMGEARTVLLSERHVSAASAEIEARYIVLRKRRTDVEDDEGRGCCVVELYGGWRSLIW
jgi:hypothetical protein